MLFIVHSFDLSINRRHDVSNFESNSAYFNQILFVKTITRNLLFRTIVLSNYSPYFFFWFLLQDLVNTCIDKVFVVHPVIVIKIKYSCNNFFFFLFYHSFFLFVEVIWIRASELKNTFVPENSIVTLYFKRSTFNFKPFEVEKPMRLSGPSMSVNFNFRQLFYALVWGNTSNPYFAWLPIHDFLMRRSCSHNNLNQY